MKWIRSSAEWLGDSAAVFCRRGRVTRDGPLQDTVFATSRRVPTKNRVHIPGMESDSLKVGVRLRQSRPLASRRDVHGYTSKQRQGLTAVFRRPGGGAAFLLIQVHTQHILGLFFLSNVLKAHMIYLLLSCLRRWLSLRMWTFWVRCPCLN